MQTPVHSMFSNLIASSDTDITLFQQAYAYASKFNDVSLLEKIASRVPLDSDIDVLISERTELEILKTWASRSGRSTETVSKRFSKESRSTLLLDLATLEGMPEKFYTDLAKRKSINLGWKLLVNPSVPADLKLSLAETLGRNTNITNRSVWDRVKPLLSLPSELTLIFVNNNSNEKALKSLADQILGVHRNNSITSWTAEESSTILYSIFCNLSKIITTRDDYYLSYGSRNMINAIFNYPEYSESDSKNLHLELSRVIDSLQSRDSEVYSFLTSLQQTIAKREETDFDSLLQAIKVAPDPTSIINAVQEYRTACYAVDSSFDISVAGASVLVNPNVNASLVGSYAHCLTLPVACTIAEIAIDKDDAVLANELFSRSHTYISADLFTDFFDKSSDPYKFVYWLLSGSIQAPNYMTNSAAFSKNIELALNFLPASTVLNSSRYTSHVGKILSESLGSNVESWETFTSLANEWSGSFSELLKASGSLTP